MSLAAPTLSAIQNLVGNLNRENVRTKDALEKALGLVLEEDEGTSIFSFWKTENKEVGGLKITELSYREPRKDAGAVAGAHLIMRLANDGCVGRNEVLAAYPEMRITAPPAPENPDPLQSYQQETASALLTFGFSLDGEECLGKIVYSLKNP